MNPKDIAQLITEDVKMDNGLILEVAKCPGGCGAPQQQPCPTPGCKFSSKPVVNKSSSFINFYTDQSLEKLARSLNMDHLYDIADYACSFRIDHDNTALENFDYSLTFIEKAYGRDVWTIDDEKAEVRLYFIGTPDEVREKIKT